MNEWDEILREIADDPEDFERAGGTISLRRRGQDYTFELRVLPGIGPCAQLGDGRREPVEVFIQRELLRLPYLASQVCRTLERVAEKRPARFIEGPAEAYKPSGQPQRWDHALEEIKNAINMPEVGTTHIIELMAGAGQGKTVLLEQVATESVLAYQAQKYPLPIVLPVDLLGRHVGNIDDAIAGSLNNTYSCPGLTQADVILCLRQGWLVLALDGFDELVARIGIADAFTHIRELVDQLKRSGTILLSARATFFELYEIASGIRRFLTPGDGSYTTTVVRLLPWEKKQGRELFAAMGSPAPEQELDKLLGIFQEDQKIVFHPFFLTRLAVLWKKGEPFQTLPGRPEGLARAKWVIDTFIQREHQDKWTDKDGRPLLTAEQHAYLLGGIAEEMWITGAFRLNAEELRLAAQIGLADLRLPVDVLDQVHSRTPTHAALTENGRQFSFFHDQFLHYALGHRVAMYLRQNDFDSIARLFAPRTLPPDAIEWMDWFFHQDEGDVSVVERGINKLTAGGFQSPPLYENSSIVLARLLVERTEHSAVRQQRFFGDALSKSCYSNVAFDSCSFWEIDLSGTEFLYCEFTDCEFGSVLVDEGTLFVDSKLSRCKIGSVQSSEASYFSPSDISGKLCSLGATVEAIRSEAVQVSLSINMEARACLQLLVRLSEKTCDVALEDIEDKYPDIAADLLRKADARGIVRRVSRPTSGRRKEFYRFQVDRDEFLAGQGRKTGKDNIDKFWESIVAKYPAREGLAKPT